MHLSQFIKSFRPSFRQLVGYLALSIIILLVMRFFFKEIAGISEVEQDIIPLAQERFDKFFNELNENRLTSTITLALFWGAIGAIAYLIVTTAAHMIRNTQHLVVEELTYLTPDPSRIHKERFALAGRIFLRLSIILVTLFLILISIQVVLPLSLQYFDGFLSNWKDPVAPFEALIGIGSLTGSMYLITSFTKLLFSKPDTYIH